MSLQYFKILNFGHYSQRKCIKKWLRYRKNCKSISFHVYDLQINSSLICKLIRLLKYDPWKEPMMCKKNVSVAFWRRSNYTHDFRNNFSKNADRTFPQKQFFLLFAYTCQCYLRLHFYWKTLRSCLFKVLARYRFTDISNEEWTGVLLQFKRLFVCLQW